MSREAHVRFWEGLGVRFPRPTRYQLHWVLDVAFREDESRVRKGNAPENMAMMRHVALNLLKTATTKQNRVSIQSRRKLAGWDHEFLAHVLGL